MTGPVDLRHSTDPQAFGGKAANLARAMQSGLPMPPGVALPWPFVEEVAGGQSSARSRLQEAFDACGGAAAVRSSTVDEDSDAASFAGQHLTRLNVRTAEEAVEAVGEIWESARSPAAVEYRRRMGLPETPRVGVVMQRMVPARVAGVIFTRNPLNSSDELVVEASWGLGEAVVSGIVTPDRWRMARSGELLEFTPGEKDVSIVITDSGGTEETPVPDDLVESCCLGDEHLQALHELALRCEDAFGQAPQDIEWALDDQGLFLLQRRPALWTQPT